MPSNPFSVTSEFIQELNAPFSLTPEQIEFYRENGYIKLKHLLSPELLEHYRCAIAAAVTQLSAGTLPLEQRTSVIDRAFLQIMNLWTKFDEVKQFVFGKRLARVAAELMGVSGVRLYHDQALYKEPGGGITPWHADQYYWPVSNNNIITAWVPLQETPPELGPLTFCEKSQHLQFGRDVAVSDKSELTLTDALEAFSKDETGYEFGDVSFHAGWTFHRAGANATERPREVMTMIYMDEDIKLIEPINEHQIHDRESWCPGVEVGETVASALNPVLYSTVDDVRSTVSGS
ncbi:MAG TPA: phytanoyl-CoA dioxygenase family protein [Acidobacteriaceae bacterium]|jgi:ectoine hydroxylase-related dioxygenase (phytanoyl-CoA dioxygenase family)